MKTLVQLAQEGLQGFHIQEMTEVYEIDEDGKKTKSVGFFKDEKIARGFANCQTDSDYRRTGKYWLLTDGKVGFLLTKDSVILLDDEKAALEIREKALKKLTPEEREILLKT